MVAFHLVELRFLLVRHCLFLLLNEKKTIRVTKVDVIKEKTGIRRGITRFMNVQTLGDITFAKSFNNFVKILTLWKKLLDIQTFR